MKILTSKKMVNNLKRIFRVEAAEKASLGEKGGLQFSLVEKMI